jgi:YVTN family beta-propeller protein
MTAEKTSPSLGRWWPAVIAAILALPLAAAAEPFAYVANLGGNTVSVIDAADGSVAATIPVGQGPDGIAATTDGAQVYVTNFDSETVSVIDAGSNAVTATVAVGAGPVGIAITPDNAFAYVTNRGSNTVSMLRLADTVAVATVVVGAGPDAVAITPDGAFAYVTNSFARPGTVSVIATASNEVVATVPVYSAPNRVAITPDGRFAYVTDFKSWNVAVIDTATNTVTTTIPTFGRPSGIAVHPNGAEVYVVTLGGTVAVIETGGNSVTNVIQVGNNPYGIGLTRNGGIAFVANFLGGNASIIDLTADPPAVTGTIATGEKPFAVTVNCAGGECSEPPLTPRPTRTPTETWTPTPTLPPTSTPQPTNTPTPSPIPVVLEGGSSSGFPGQQAIVEVTLHAAGMLVAGTQNDLSFEASTAIAAKPNGRPDCTVNPDINKGATAFLFQPVGCTPGTDCTALRALVIAADNTDPIADGAVLYTCTVQVAIDTPPGMYPLHIFGTSSGTPSGDALSTAGTDGEIDVGTPPGATPIPTWTPIPTPTAAPATSPPTVTPTATQIALTPMSVDVGSATGQAGGRVSVDVSLQTGGNAVAGVQNDLAFDPNTPVAANADGRPDCTVNPAIDKESTSFAFEPPQCTPGTSCTAIRGVIFSTGNTDPIADGSVLYSCRFNIGRSAAPGNYPLRISGAIGSDPHGNSLAADGTDGEITVQVASAALGVSADSAGGPSAGGCEMGGSASAGSLAWLFLIPVLLWWWRHP